MKLYYKILLISIVISLYSLTIGAQIDNSIVFETFNTESGLSASAVNQSIKDSKGFLWIATSNGLNRFDGLNYQVFKQEENNPNSLTGNSIRTLFEDSKGYIWIGTLKNGLNRYDYNTGKFTAFLHNDTDDNSISSNEILAIYEDKDNRLWIGTEQGLNLFDYETEIFTSFITNKDIPTSISSNAILSIQEDQRGWLWVGTWGGGLNLVIPTKQKDKFNFRHFKSVEGDASQLKTDHVWKLFLDSKGRFWQGVFNGGLALMLPNNNTDPNTFQPQFLSYNSSTFPDAEQGLNNDLLFSIDEDKKGAIWLGTSFGISIFYPDQYFSDLTKIRLDDISTIPIIDFTSFQHSVFNPETLPSDNIKDIFIDKTEIVWVASTGGLSKYDPNSIRFEHYLKTSTLSSTIYITCFAEEDENTVWIGTNTGNGLLKYDLLTHTYQAYQHEVNTPNALPDNNITALLKVAPDSIWIGMGSGLGLFNPKTNSFKSVKIIDQYNNVVNINNIEVIFKDRQQRYWLGTDNGLILFTPKTSRAIVMDSKKESPIQLPNPDINHIIEGNNGDIWVASYGGLYKITSTNKKFNLKVYSNDLNDPKSICSNRIFVLCKNEREIWIGTEDGLARYNPSTDDFYNITSKNGLNNPLILGLLSDKNNNIWASTRQGLFSLDVENQKIRYFDKQDGLQSNNFNSYSAHKGKSRLYFGGINGFNAFSGESIALNQTPPPIFITDIKIFSKSKSFGEDVTELDEIELSYQENYFTINFSALNFTQAHENQYAYMLEGFDKDWIYCGQRNFASYTNLDGGTYTLRVKAANNDGFWNEKGRSLKITVVAPLWKRGWFIGLSILSILGLSYFGYWWRITDVRRKKKLLEIEVKARTQEIEELAQQLKAQNSQLEEKVEERTKAIEKANLELQRSNLDLEQFAYAASHDLQEPLRTVGNFVQLLKRRYASKLDDNGRDYIDFTVDGVKRMSVLIRGLLEYSRIGRADMAFHQADLESVVRDKITDLSMLIEDKKAKVGLQQLPNKIYCEPNQLGIVFYNLIGNALKFNEAEHPKVNIRLEKETESHYIFAIQDNGIGIEEEYREKIFEVFKRLHHRGEYEGTGIGLASCRRIIIRHEGEIWLDSEFGKGTTFYFSVSKQLSSKEG